MTGARPDHEGNRNPTAADGLRVNGTDARTTAADGIHVAIIMDGNGRWAEARGWVRSAGHRAGASAVRRVVEAAPGLGIRTLTLYAFSADNWKRPQAEVGALLRLFLRYLRTETARCREEGVVLNVIGRRDRLPDVLRRAIENAEAQTAGGAALELRLAIDYSARDAIVRAQAMAAAATRAEFAAALAAVLHARRSVPDVDLLIRTGGEQRLSDFLLWECAYAELYFTPCCWPDFDEAALAEALERYRARVRRFGGLEAVRAGALGGRS